MNIFKSIIYRLLYRSDLFIKIDDYFASEYPDRNKFGAIAPSTMLQYPIHAESPQSIFFEENTRIRNGVCFINAPGEKVFIRKYSAIGTGTLFIPGNHTSTVGVPHYLLAPTHINDKSKDIVVEEDCWVGANVTLLAGAHLGRGCIVASGCIVSRPVPPYAVVVGTPQKIIAKKFEIDDIIEHEKVLYKQEDRMTRQQLEELFAEYFVDKKTFGTNNPLTDEEKDRINELKIKTHFVEPY